jgi:hypothetical protein
MGLRWCVCGLWGCGALPVRSARTAAICGYLCNSGSAGAVCDGAVQQHQRQPYLVVVVHSDRHDGGACLAMSVEEHIGLTLRQTLTADQVEGGVGGGRRGRGGGEEGAAVGDGRPQSPACKGMAQHDCRPNSSSQIKISSNSRFYSWEEEPQDYSSSHSSRTWGFTQRRTAGHTVHHVYLLLPSPFPLPRRTVLSLG